jgi:hypothetical protein
LLEQGDKLDRFTPGHPSFDPALVVMAGLLLVLLVWSFLLSLRLRAYGQRFRYLLAGPSGANLEDILHDFARRAEGAEMTAARSAELLEMIGEGQRNCIQRVGVVRYDAFPDVGGGLSFSLAVTDEPGNGVVMTSLYGREGCRIYAKSLVRGESEIPLSNEEQQAIRQAMASSIYAKESA